MRPSNLTSPSDINDGVQQQHRAAVHSAIAERAARCDRRPVELSLDREVERVRQETSSIDPLPFQDDETVWSVVGEEIAGGQCFAGGSPGARSLYG
ncbi:SUKH-4 family immunity protein [Streptomyces pratensis]|uniref:SUKH-4 family immunity protein n=1 Tax=Streptomyces pratensis TaxID=1169025 RepID=UPI003624E083